MMKLILGAASGCAYVAFSVVASIVLVAGIDKVLSHALRLDNNLGGGDCGTALAMAAGGGSDALALIFALSAGDDGDALALIFVLSAG